MVNLMRGMAMLDAQSIMNLMPGGVLLIDDELRICFLNEWVAQVSGRSRQELQNIQIKELIDGISLDQDAGDQMIPNQCTLITASRALLPVNVTLRMVPGPDSPYTCICMMAAPEAPGTAAELSAVELPARDHFFGLYGRSEKMQEVYGFIAMAAETDANVVILGESGTGKELVASAIHHASSRSDKPFVKVNCAALSETLLESELFGHAKGAFTGAYRDHQGKFEFADKGTLFLDEIGEISPSMQAKLLRVLQERVVMRVGDNSEISVDVRIIVATNRNLRTLVSKGKFREDLYYRLNVFPLHIPALRERATDIPLLIEHFISKYRSRTGKQIETCSADVMRILMAYCWPGNVRELENIIEHAFILSRSSEIQVIDLPHDIRVAAVREGICAERIAGVMHTIATTPVQLRREGGSRLSISREMLEQELERHGGNKTATARALGISKVGLWKKMKKLGMG